MNPMITVLVPESELPAEGADAQPLADGNQPVASDLLAACSELLASSSLTFSISADGAVTLDSAEGSDNLLALEVSGEAGAEPEISLAGDSPRGRVDLAAAASSVTGTFDAEDGMRKLIGSLASQLRPVLDGAGGSPVPLIRWIKPEETAEDEEAE